MSKVARAIISVSDKRGIVELAKELHSMGIEILSTGGTARTLRDAGIAVKEVSQHTGSPEMLDGRVKTLHPRIHGGLLWRRDNDKDMEEVQKYEIDSIDLIIVNLYPFEETISRPGTTFEEAIENIDIGGPAMLRSGSKNFPSVAVVVDPQDYEKVVSEMKSNHGEISYETKLRLAGKVFKMTSRYDGLIAQYLEKVIRERTE